MVINVIGDGSAGHRHARLLRERGHTVKVLGINDRVHPVCEAVVIATPPEAHEHYLKSYWEYLPILCEGPVTWVGEPTYIPQVRMVASNWRFVPQMQHLKKIINERKSVSAHLWFDWSLPLWRPDTDYRKTCYFASGIDNINLHEVDMALWLFGHPAAIHVERVHTGLSQGVDALAMVIKHERGTLTTINSGWHSTIYQRGMRVVFEDGTSEEIGWASPQDDAIVNVSYAALIDEWLAAIEEDRFAASPTAWEGYRAYKATRGEII